MLAITPDPPYVAVIFSAMASAETDGYDQAVREMRALAEQQPGYLGVEAAGGGPGEVEITVSYWSSEAHARAWKEVAEHVNAQRLGQDRWYDEYQVRVGQIERVYGTR